MRAAPYPFPPFFRALKSAVSNPTVPGPLVLVPLLATVLLQGCAANRTDTAQLDCKALKQVIEAADSDLSRLTATRTSTRYGNVWRAKADAYGNGCTLASTTDVPTRYFCTIPAASDSQVLSVLQEEVASCLGSEWQRNPASARSGERFSRPGGDVVVDVGASDAEASRAEVVGLLVRRRQP